MPSKAVYFEHRLVTLTVFCALLGGCATVPRVTESHKEIISSAKTVYIAVLPPQRHRSDFQFFDKAATNIFAAAGMTRVASRKLADVVFLVTTSSVPWHGQNCSRVSREHLLCREFGKILVKGEFRLYPKKGAATLHATFESKYHDTWREAFQESGFLQHLLNVMDQVYGLPLLARAAKDSEKTIQDEAGYLLWEKYLVGVWVPRESPCHAPVKLTVNEGRYKGIEFTDGTKVFNSRNPRKWAEPFPSGGVSMRVTLGKDAGVGTSVSAHGADVVWNYSDPSKGGNIRNPHFSLRVSSDANDRGKAKVMVENMDDELRRRFPLEKMELRKCLDEFKVGERVSFSWGSEELTGIIYEFTDRPKDGASVRTDDGKKYGIPRKFLHKLQPPGTSVPLPTSGE